MTPTDAWRDAMHRYDQQCDQRDRLVRGVIHGLALIVASLSVGLIVMGLGVAGWWGVCTGGLGLVGAALLWWEV